MPNEQATFTTKILISGGTDPSLLKSFGYTEKQLVQFNKLTQSLGTNAALSVKHYAKISPELQKANVQGNTLLKSMNSVAKIAGGMAIGSALISGLQTAVGLAERLATSFMQFSEYSSKASEDWQVRVKGLGGVIGSEYQGQQLAKQAVQIGKKSPFWGRDILGMEQEFAGRGMPTGMLEPTAKMIGDIAARLGANPEIMSRLSLAYGEAFDQKVVDKRIINQFSKAGVNVLDTLMRDKGLNPEDTNDTQKMFSLIHKHQVMFTDIQKALTEMTTTGRFAHGMTDFSTTVRGITTTFDEEMYQASVDFGRIINDVKAPILALITDSPMWDKFTNWADLMDLLAQSTVNFVKTLPSSQVFGQLQPYLNFLQTEFAGFNKWLGSFFTLVEIPNQGNQYVLSATGTSQVKEYLNDLVSIMEKTGKVMTVIGNIGSRIGDALNAMGKVWQFYEKMDQMVWNVQNHVKQSLSFAVSPTSIYDTVPAFASGGIVNSPTLGMIGEAGPEAVLPLSGESVLDDISTTLSNLNSFLTYGFPQGGGGIGAVYGGGSGASGALGSWLANTQYGPGVDYVDANGRVHGTPDSDSTKGIGHIHGVAYSLGAGSVAMHAEYAEGVLHLKPGQWFTNPRNGKRQRWGDTSGARNPENIDEFVPANGGVTINYHIHAINTSDANKFAKEHARTIKKHIDNESSHVAKVNSKGMV
jgi:hypothetical protein